jgi:hypothetical protein
VRVCESVKPSRKTARLWVDMLDTDTAVQRAVSDRAAAAFVDRTTRPVGVFELAQRRGAVAGGAPESVTCLRVLLLLHQNRSCTTHRHTF